MALTRQEFVAAPALAPPTAHMDADFLKNLENETNIAAANPLPDDASDDDL